MSLSSSINFIKKAGFGYIKVELEAEMYRRYNVDVEVCQEYIMENISDEAKNALKYIECYNDGSVDTELTFTLPIEKSHLIPQFIEAFKGITARFDLDEMSVVGAGMHIGILPTTSNGVYPCDHYGLDSIKYANFRSEVKKLLPALFVAACSKPNTRPLRYRYPDISSETKQSAIYSRSRSMLEYRLFDTCYDNPELVFDYIGVIARTLEYYNDTAKKVTEAGIRYRFYSTVNGVESILQESDQARAIKKHINRVIPKGQTMKSFLKKRGIDLSVSKFVEKEHEEEKNRKELARQAKEAYDIIMSSPLTKSEARNYPHLDVVSAKEASRSCAHLQSLHLPSTTDRVLERITV